MNTQVKVLCKVNELGGRFTSVSDEYAVMTTGVIFNTKTGNRRVGRDNGNPNYNRPCYITLKAKEDTNTKTRKFTKEEIQLAVTAKIREMEW